MRCDRVWWDFMECAGVVVWCGVLRCGEVWCGEVWCGEVWCGWL